MKCLETVYPSALAPENCLMFKYLEDEPHWRMKLLQSMPNDGGDKEIFYSFGCF